MRIRPIVGAVQRPKTWLGGSLALPKTTSKWEGDTRVTPMDIVPVPLSTYGAACSTPSPVNRMMSAFAAGFREDVDINLGVGYVNENTIPRELVETALHEVLARPDTYRLALNYGGSTGSENLIASLRRYLVEQRVGGLTRAALADRRIVIGPNGATSLLEAVAHLLPRGIVVTSDPIYYIYCHLLERLGFDVLAVPEDDDGIDVDRLQQAIDRLGADAERIRCFYVVTVGNPTSSVLSGQRTRRLVEIATRLSHRLRREVPVFVDQAYQELIHDPEAERPAAALLADEMGLVYQIGTLSKVLAPALRIGYMIGRDGPLLQAVTQKTNDAGFSAPLITQEIASYLLDHHVAEQVARVNRGYREKAVQTRRWFEQYLGNAVAECRGGRAGFYYYLTLRDVETHEQSPLFRYLARTTGRRDIDGPPDAQRPRVLYVPGEFCVHPRGQLVEQGRRQLRISYGFEELPRIEQALRMMAEAIAFARAS